MSVTYSATGTRVQSAGATTLTPTKPGLGTITGGALLAALHTKNNDTHSTATGGWTKIAQVNSGASFTASLWIAPQGSSNPVFTWTNSAACGAQISHYYEPNSTIDGTAVGTSGSNTGSTATHSTSSITTTRDESMAVYVDCAAANTALGTPSGWTENSDAGSATDAGQTTFGNKVVASSGGSSGAISVTGANAAWVQFQVELRRTVATAYDASEVAALAFLDSPDGLVGSKVGTLVWLDVTPPYEVSKVGVLAWLDAPTGGRRRQIINC